MSKIQIKTEVDLLAILTQLDTDELEEVAKEIDKILIERKSNKKKVEIAALIRILNERCVLANNDLNRFYELRKKREEQELSPKELKELFKLIQKEEALRIERVKVLGEISQLKGISLTKLNKELGIKMSKRA